MTRADSEHRLLLSHLQTWATAKQRPVDVDLLDDLLELRAAYGEQNPTYWPEGSMDDLMLDLLPGKATIEAPDPDELASTMDTFVRFLRNTGRLAARSATPDALRRESRRAARRVPDAMADRGAWSPGKVLGDFGESLGLSLEDAPDVETLKARMAEVQDRWNALPVHERRRLMPTPGHDDRPGLERAMDAYGTDDEVTALLMTFAQELPSGTLPAPDATAPQVRRAGLVPAVIELARWVGESEEVTGTHVLRPAAAHRAYDDLGLVETDRARLRNLYEHWVPPGVAEYGVEAYVDKLVARPWSRAADCESLDRLWHAAIACGAVTVAGKRATGHVPEHLDDDTWVDWGVRASIGVLERRLQNPYGNAGLLYALMRSYVRSRALVSWDEVADFADAWESTDEERAALAAGDFDRRGFDVDRHRRACFALRDTGILRESEDGVTLSEFGDVFVTAWLTYTERMSYRSS
ncbi:MAG: hypothetical protein ACRDO8_12650 [Nocardioidaceae bacterium]